MSRKVCKCSILATSTAKGKSHEEEMQEQEKNSFESRRCPRQPIYIVLKLPSGSHQCPFTH